MTTALPAPSLRAAGSAPSSGERSVILASLARIRRRLFGVRILERIAVGLAWGAALALFLTASRLLRDRFPWFAAAVALLPLLPAVWIWFKAKNFPNTIGLAPWIIRSAALLTALLSIAMIILTFISLGAAIPLWTVPAATAALFVIAAAATVRMIDARTAAIFVDQQVNLDERVSTALEMLESPAHSEFEAAFHAPVIASALGACRQVRTAKVGYHRLDRRMYALAATIAIAAAGLTLITPLPALARPTHKTRVIVSTQAKQLQQVFKELEEKRPSADKVTAEKLKPIEHALQQLQQGNMSPIEASAVLSEAKEEMKRDQDALAASDKVQQMLKQLDQTRDFAQANDTLKKADVGQAKGDAGAAAQRMSAEKALADAAKGLADKAAGMSEGDRKNLAGELRAAADKASADPQLRKDLQSAAGAAESGDGNKLSQSLQSAGQRMSQQQADSQQSQDSVRQAMAEIDRLQGNGSSSGSQSTMADSGNQGQNGQNGQNGNQGGPQGSQANGGQNGKEGQNGQNGQNGQPGGSQASGGQAAQSGNNSGSGAGQQTTASSGSTNMEQQGGPGDKHIGDPIGGRSTWVTVYDQRQTNSKGTEEKIGSHINPLAGPANGSIDVMGKPDDPNSQIRSYSEVLPDARQRAMDELSRQEIPPQYQDLIKAFYQK